MSLNVSNATPPPGVSVVFRAAPLWDDAQPSWVTPRTATINAAPRVSRMTVFMPCLLSSLWTIRAA